MSSIGEIPSSLNRYRMVCVSLSPCCKGSAHVLFVAPMKHCQLLSKIFLQYAVVQLMSGRVRNDIVLERRVQENQKTSPPAESTASRVNVYTGLDPQYEGSRLRQIVLDRQDPRSTAVSVPRYNAAASYSHIDAFAPPSPPRDAWGVAIGGYGDSALPRCQFLALSQPSWCQKPNLRCRENTTHSD